MSTDTTTSNSNNNSQINIAAETTKRLMAEDSMVTPPRSIPASPELNMVNQLSANVNVAAAAATASGTPNYYVNQVASYAGNNSDMTDANIQQQQQQQQNNANNVAAFQFNSMYQQELPSFMSLVNHSNPSNTTSSDVQQQQMQQQQQQAYIPDQFQTWTQTLNGQQHNKNGNRSRNDSIQSELSNAFSDALPPIPTSNPFMLDVAPTFEPNMYAQSTTETFIHPGFQDQLSLFQPNHVSATHTTPAGMLSSSNSAAANMLQYQQAHHQHHQQLLHHPTPQQQQTFHNQTHAQQQHYQIQFDQAPERPSSAPGFQIQNDSGVTTTAAVTAKQGNPFLDNLKSKMQQRRRTQSTNSALLLSMAETVTEGDEKRFKCPKPMCSKTYKNSNGLKYHLEYGNCELECANEQEMEQMVHGSNNEIRVIRKPYNCHIPGCGKRYKNLNGLKYHANANHPYVKFEDVYPEAPSS